MILSPASRVTSGPAPPTVPADNLPPSESAEAPPVAPSLAVRAAGSSIWSVASQIVQVVLGVAAFALLSHWLTPHEYGLFGMAATATAFVGVVGDVGVTSAVVRLTEVDASAEATAFWLAVGGASILTLITAIAAPIIAWFYRTPAITPLALGLATNFLLAAPGRVPNAMLARELRFRASTIISLVASVGSVGAAVALAAHGYGTWALVAQMLLSMALQSLFSIAVVRPHIRPQLVARLKAREMAGISSRLSGFSFATMMGRALDNILAGRLLGSAAVGLMTMGNRLIYVPLERLCGAIYTVFLPASVQLSDVEKRAAAFQSTLRLLFLVVGPMAFGAVAIAPEVVALLPAKWSALGSVLRIYALTALCLPVNYLSLSVLVAHGRATVLLRMAVALIPVCWAGALLGALSGSVIAMVIAWSFAVVAAAAVELWFTWRELRLTPAFWRGIGLPIGVSAAMAGGVWATVHFLGLAGTRIGVAVGVPVGIVLYVVLAKATMAADVSRMMGLLGRSVAIRRAAR